MTELKKYEISIVAGDCTAWTLLFNTRPTKSEFMSRLDLKLGTQYKRHFKNNELYINHYKANLEVCVRSIFIN